MSDGCHEPDLESKKYFASYVHACTDMYPMAFGPSSRKKAKDIALSRSNRFAARAHDYSAETRYRRDRQVGRSLEKDAIFPQFPRLIASRRGGMEFTLAGKEGNWEEEIHRERRNGSSGSGSWKMRERERFLIVRSEQNLTEEEEAEEGRRE